MRSCSVQAVFLKSHLITAMNEKLVGKLEDKAKIVEKLECDLLSERRKNSAHLTAKEKVMVEEEIDRSRQTEIPPSIEEIRQMEADLKRKSGLLSEVKVLLKQAAERERAAMAERENLKAQIKNLVEINPKTPSEVLAKELRQARLMIDRLTCEKKELEHKVASGEN